MNMLPSAHMSSTLPPLYASWMEQILTGPIPEETEATCEHCAMCVQAHTRPTISLYLFNPQTKCCTYMPRLPNFLVGRILEDPEPDLLRGRMSVEARIRRKVAITLLCLASDPVQATLFACFPGKLSFRSQVSSFRSVVFLSLASSQETMCKQKESRMKDKKNQKVKRDKKSMKTPKKDLKTPAVPVPTTATELSEEDLKKVTGGVGRKAGGDQIIIQG